MNKLKDGITPIPNRFILDGTVAKLSGPARKVYDAITIFADYTTGRSWPGYETIKRLSGVTSGSRLHQYIEELIKAGLIEADIQHKVNDNGQLEPTKRRHYRRIS